MPDVPTTACWTTKANDDQLCSKHAILGVPLPVLRLLPYYLHGALNESRSTPAVEAMQE